MQQDLREPPLPVLLKNEEHHHLIIDVSLMPPRLSLLSLHAFVYLNVYFQLFLFGSFPFVVFVSRRNFATSLLPSFSHILFMNWLDLISFKKNNNCWQRVGRENVREEEFLPSPQLLYYIENESRHKWKYKNYGSTINSSYSLP